MRRSFSSSGSDQPFSNLYSINATTPGKPRQLNCYFFHDSSSSSRSPSRTQMQQRSISYGVSHHSDEMQSNQQASGRDRPSKERNNTNMSDSFSSLEFNRRPLKLSHQQTPHDRRGPKRHELNLPNYSTSSKQEIKTVASSPREVSLRTRKTINALLSSTGDPPISSITSAKTSGTTSQPATKSFSITGEHCRNPWRSRSPGMCLQVGKSTIPGTYCDVGKSITGKYCDVEKSIPGEHCDGGKSIPGIYCDAGKLQAQRYLERSEEKHFKEKPQHQPMGSSILHNCIATQDVQFRDCDTDIHEKRAVCNVTEQPRTSSTKFSDSQKADQKNAQRSNKDSLIETTVLETLARRSALALQEEIEISHAQPKQRQPTCKHSPNSYNATGSRLHVADGIANASRTHLEGKSFQSNTIGTVSKSDCTRLNVPLLIAGEHIPRCHQTNNIHVPQRRAHSVHFDRISSVQSAATTSPQPRHTVCRTEHAGIRSDRSKVEPPVANIIQVENTTKGLEYADSQTEGAERTRSETVEFISKQPFSMSESVDQQSSDANELSKTKNQPNIARRKKQDPTSPNNKEKRPIRNLPVNVSHKISDTKAKHSPDVKRSVCSSEQHEITINEVNEPVVEAFIIPVEKKRDIPHSLELILATLITNAPPHVGNNKESSKMSGVHLPTKSLTRLDHECSVEGESCVARRFSTNLQVQLQAPVLRPHYKGNVCLVESNVHKAKPNQSSDN